VIRWIQITETQAQELTSCSATPGYAFPISVDSLPSNLKQMSNIRTAYVSGYCDAVPAAQGLTGVGEIVVEREDQGTMKGYNFFLAVSGADVFFCGPFKSPSGHHYSTDNPTPIENLFGHSPFTKGRIYGP
jgi:hypothetical protein